jgi:hypothetical protein
VRHVGCLTPSSPAWYPSEATQRGDLKCGS